MKHKIIKRLKSLLTDSLLPLNKKNSFDPYVQDFDRLAPKLKLIYPDVQAPYGFSGRVMHLVREQQRVEKFSFFAGGARAYMATAVCAAVIFGLFFGYRLLPDATEMKLGDALNVPAINGEKVDDYLVAIDPLQNDVIDVNDLLQADAPLIALSVPGNDSPLPSQQQIAAVEPVTLPLPEQQKPLATVQATQPVSQNGVKVSDTANIAVPQPVPAGIIGNRQVVYLNESDIPSPRIYQRRKREINAVAVRLETDRIEDASALLVNRAALYGGRLSMMSTELRDDSTLVKIQVFAIPENFINHFIMVLPMHGKILQQTKVNTDITAEYSALLDTQAELAATLVKTGENSEELRQVIKDLIVLDRSSVEGIYNVTVVFEDSMEF